MQKKWKIKKSELQLCLKIAGELNVPPIMAQLLINRGIVDVKEAATFLKADMSGLHDPFLFKNMSRVVERIKTAQIHKERVLIFGDYDVDGVTSSVLLNQVLSQLGIDVIHHIPHRMKDGYGLNHEIGDHAKKEGVSLIIAVDCGITAKEDVAHLNDMDFETIIIDHHEPSDEGVPEAYAIINPKQKDCPYPFKELASVGLVAKVAQALIGKLSGDMLDLVAMGTIADVVPLRDENRIFVKAGLPRISETKNLGLLALMDVAKIKGKKITPHYIGFILGPRINATGRMDSAHRSLELFLSQDREEAYHLARILDKHNTARQKVQRDMIQEAIDIIEQEVNFKDQKVIVLHKEGWHKGVLGIVASRIADKYYRPAVVISTENGVGTASCRSIEGFHLHDALTDCAVHLEEFGGHEGAAGLTIKQENIDPFRALINEVATQTLIPAQLVPTVSIDCEISLKEISLNLAEMIDDLQPYGQGNPTPVFCSRGLIAKSFPQVLGRDTLKFWVTDGNVAFSAVGFGMGKYKSMVTMKEPIDLVYEIIIDDWNKAPVPQLKLKDIKISGS